MADFNFVLPRLATGAAIADETDVAALVTAGVTVVLDAQAERDDGALLAAHPAITYCWNPTDDDGTSKPPSYWATTLRFVLPLYAQSAVKVYCHCAAGHNRGPSNAAAVMMALGFTKDSAKAIIQAARPQATIAYLEDAAAAIPILGYA